MHKSSITISCSTSARELPEVKALLIPSLLRQKKIGQIELILTNYSGKGVLYKGRRSFKSLTVKEISKKEQCGFSEAHNFAFQTIRPKNYFIAANPIYFHEEALFNLLNTFKSNSKVGIIGARQLPFSHPKEFDKETGETPWVTGSCMLINSDFFEKVKGFDENFWMYTEDVDLSWRAWLNNYKVLYEPKASVYHFTGAYFSYFDHRYYLEQFWSARNFIYLLWKYWKKSGEKKALKMFEKTDFPDYFKKEVIKAFNKLKNSLALDFYNVDMEKLTSLTSKIKVLGYNLFHRMQS